ncbi:MAG: hypothetical protein ISP73_00095 [Flavobacteriales bacterium]|nr:hypothetical protein [Flavobacteriales bacterium]
MIVKLSIILDHQSDVFREVKVDSSSSLQELHDFIVQVFELKTDEMAAFYLTNEDWEQNEEIPLIAMDANSSMEMGKLSISDIFAGHDRLLYVNDFLVMWRFMIEVVEKDESKTIDKAELFLSFGKMPEETPQVQFVSEKDPYSSEEDIFYEEHDEFNEFESYDDY